MIKQTLQTYYGEKRDLTTLDHQLMSCAQHGQAIDLYYDQINKLLSAIVNHLRTDDRYQHPEALTAMLQAYNYKAIDAFIRGLDGDLGKFLRNYRPTSLAQAYAYCLSFHNVEYRKTFIKSKLPENLQITKPIRTNQPANIYITIHSLNIIKIINSYPDNIIILILHLFPNRNIIQTFLLFHDIIKICHLLRDPNIHQIHHL